MLVSEEGINFEGRCWVFTFSAWIIYKDISILCALLKANSRDWAEPGLQKKSAVVLKRTRRLDDKMEVKRSIRSVCDFPKFPATFEPIYDSWKLQELHITITDFLLKKNRKKKKIPEILRYPDTPQWLHCVHKQGSASHVPSFSSCDLWWLQSCLQNIMALDGCMIHWMIWMDPKNSKQNITLSETNSKFAPENWPKPKRKFIWTNHPFSGASCLFQGG